jgi:hypothetical protein
VKGIEVTIHVIGLKLTTNLGSGHACEEVVASLHVLVDQLHLWKKEFDDDKEAVL